MEARTPNDGDLSDKSLKEEAAFMAKVRKEKKNLAEFRNEVLESMPPEP